MLVRQLFTNVLFSFLLSYFFTDVHSPTKIILRGLAAPRPSARGRNFDDQQTPLVVQQVNAFIAAHDKDVRAQQGYGISPRWTGPQAKFVNAREFQRVSIPTGRRSMASEWVLEFAADGTVKKAEPFDALPNFIAANSHHGLVAQFETESAGNGAPERFALKTVDLKKSDWPLGPTITR